MDALIGSTGFVGSTLARQHSFGAHFNSRTIADTAHGDFGTVVCAAAPGSMFEANRQPDADKAKIEALLDHLSRIRTERFVLISSIAVLADFAGGDDEATRNFQTDLAYGRHRRELEAVCETTFAECLVVRLPALFGHGLKKNFIFDLMNPVPTMLTEAKYDAMMADLPATARDLAARVYAHDPATGMWRLDRAALDASTNRATLDAAATESGLSAIQFHHPDTTYQFYDMKRLWDDIGVATQAGLGHIHLATEPLAVAHIHDHLLGTSMPQTGARLHREDMRTAHADLWDVEGPYLEGADLVLARLEGFFDDRRRVA